MKKIRAIYNLMRTKNYFLVTAHSDDLLANVSLDEPERAEVEGYVLDLLEGKHGVNDIDRQKLLN